MSYDYKTQKPEVFKPENQVEFLKARDKVHELLRLAGAFRMQEAFGSGDTWKMMAYIDRLVELGEIVEVKRDCMAQHRIFTA